MSIRGAGSTAEAGSARPRRGPACPARNPDQLGASLAPPRAAAAGDTDLLRRWELSTMCPVAALSRTALMPAAAPLMVLNSGETATTVPSDAVSLKKFDAVR